MIQQRLDLTLEILFVGAIYLGGKLERQLGPLGDLDGLIGALFRRKAADECEILPRLRMVPQQVRRQAVIDGRLPVHVRQRLSLIVRNRNHRHLAEFLVQRHEVGQVETTVERGDMRMATAARQREVQVINVVMNDVELVGAARYLLEQQDMMRQLIDASLIEA